MDTKLEYDWGNILRNNQNIDFRVEDKNDKRVNQGWVVSFLYKPTITESITRYHNFSIAYKAEKPFNQIFSSISDHRE